MALLDVAVRVFGDKTVSLQTTENSYIDISVAHGHCALYNIKVSFNTGVTKSDLSDLLTPNNGVQLGYERLDIKSCPVVVDTCRE